MPTQTTTSTFPRSSSRHPAIRVRTSTRGDGDFHLRQSAETLAQRRRALIDRPWVQLAQRHGTDVVTVSDAAVADGAAGDVAITDRCGIVVAAWTADCAPVVLIGAHHEFSVIHAGWRGLAAGILKVATELCREPVVGAIVGPCIRACCYEFGEAEAEQVADGVSADVQSITTRSPVFALDMFAAVSAGLNGIPVVDRAVCTACSYRGYSHRRGDTGRHVTAVWQEDTDV